MVFPGGLEALQGIHLELQAGEFVSLVGPSGCGKSTVLRMMAGLLQPTTGDVTVAGLHPRRARREKQDVSFVFQEATLLAWRSVRDNVRLPLELRGIPARQASESVQTLLALVGLTEFEDAYPRQLSGGMRMRASIARALVTRPDLLLMDEPFGSLDEITRQRLNEDLLALWMRDRWTALFVTHNVYEAVFLGGRVLVMSARPGRLVGDFDVPFQYPRPGTLRADPDFARLAGKVSDCLREHA